MVVTIEQQQSYVYVRAARWLRYAGWSCLVLLLLIGTHLLALRVQPAHLYHIDVGGRGDRTMLKGVYESEIDGTGATYRWTSARATIAIRGFPQVATPLFVLRIGGIPPDAVPQRPTSLFLDQTELVLPVVLQARHYHTLLPRAALNDGTLVIAISSPTSQAASDPRAIGVRLDDIALGWSAGQWVLPPAWLLLVQWITLLAWIGIGQQLGVSRWWRALAVIIGVVLLTLITASDALIAPAWHARLGVASLAVFAGVGWIVPRLHRWLPQSTTGRAIRQIGLITVLAIAVRLIVIFYPPFDGHDLYIHRDRLADVQHGQLLLYDTPSEFAEQRTLVQPAFYVLVNPLTLLTADSQAAIQGLYALLDGASALLIWLLVRHLGGSTRAANIAALAIAFLPIQFTALWWGFAPQVVGQWLVLLLAVFATQSRIRSRSFWICAGLITTLALLIHNGVAILLGVWLAAYIALLWLWQRRDRLWLRWLVLLSVASIISVVLLYADVIALQVAGLAGGASTPQRFTTGFRLLLLGRGLLASLRPIDAATTLICLAFLLWWSRAEQRWLVWAWLISAVLFLVVDIVSGLQVRYAYFAIPLVCAGFGLLLDQIMTRRQWGRLVGLSMIGLIIWMGSVLWFPGVFAAIKPTLTALTH